MSTMPIVELVDVCEEMAARHERWFRLTGRRVAEETEPARQRWLSGASHRHAWHARLWRERRPSIPVDAATAPVDDGRIDEYPAALAQLRADTAGIIERVDPELDPSTHRTAVLVLADLDALIAERPR